MSVNVNISVANQTTFNNNCDAIFVIFDVTIVLLISIAGVCGNGLVVVWATYFSRLTVPINVYVINLAVADCVFGAVLMLFVPNLLTCRPFLSNFLCQLSGVFLGCSLLTSVYTQMTIAIGRCRHMTLIVCRPSKAAGPSVQSGFGLIRSRMSSALLLVILLWLTGFTLLLPINSGRKITDWDHITFNNKTHACSNIRDGEHYGRVILVLGLAVPLVVTIAAYSIIYGIVERRQRRRRQRCSRHLAADTMRETAIQPCNMSVHQPLADDDELVVPVPVPARSSIPSGSDRRSDTIKGDETDDALAVLNSEHSRHFCYRFRSVYDDHETIMNSSTSATALPTPTSILTDASNRSTVTTTSATNQQDNDTDCQKKCRKSSTCFALSRSKSHSADARGRLCTSSLSRTVQDRMLTRLMMTVFIGFVACFGLYFVVNCAYPEAAKWPSWLHKLSAWLVYLHCCVNPILYGINHDQFWHDFVGLWERRRRSVARLQP